MINNRFFDKAWLLNGITTLLLAFAALAVEWLQRDKQHALQFSNRKPFNNKVVRWSIYLLIATNIVIWGGQPTPFVYFQF